MYDLTATCAFGLEALVARELRALGCQQVQPDNGSVSFQGDGRALCRANLWLRTADRVWLRMGRFNATTFEELFENVKALPWSDLLPRNAAFPVSGMSHESQLSSVPACQAIVKKAAVESMKRSYRVEWFPEDGPQFKIRVSLIRDVCTIGLDSSGAGLHKRGYRTLTAEAPLRETLAAGLVELSYWNGERTLVDPFCGSGTICLEAALISLRRAPGWRRSFAAEDWPLVSPGLWREARQEVEDVFDRSTRLHIQGYDADDAVLRMARHHLRESGLSERGITFQQRPVAQLSTQKKYGVIITNPPYGERLLEHREAEQLYEQLGVVTAPLDTWSVYVLTSHAEFEKHYGQARVRKRKLYNGMKVCWYYQFPGPAPPRKAAETKR